MAGKHTIVATRGGKHTGRNTGSVGPTVSALANAPKHTGQNGGKSPEATKQRIHTGTDAGRMPGPGAC